MGQGATWTRYRPNEIQPERGKTPRSKVFLSFASQKFIDLGQPRPALPGRARAKLPETGKPQANAGQGQALLARSMKPTMAPQESVARVPDNRVRGDSARMSSRREGTIALRPPIMMPRLPILAKPHSA